MRKMGHVQGGAHTVIRALIDVVGPEGAIVMSAYRVTPIIPLTEEEKRIGLIAKVRKLPEDTTAKTGMGVISDTFRTWPETRLGEGINRVCAWGKDAGLHSQGYQYLLSIDGSVLLIGVDINRCSSMHTAEDQVGLPEKIENRLAPPPDLRARYPQAQWYVEYNAPGKPPPVDAWGKIQAEANRRGHIRHGRVGEAECMLFKARQVVGIYEEQLRRDPFGLFEIEKD
jgi:aminoglycoside 3-N-acetyltransferase